MTLFVPIAKCTRCGRDFVSVDVDGDMIDHGPDRSMNWAVEGVPECGGRIEMQDGFRKIGNV